MCAIIFISATYRLSQKCADFVPYIIFLLVGSDVSLLLFLCKHYEKLSNNFL